MRSRCAASAGSNNFATASTYPRSRSVLATAVRAWCTAAVPIWVTPAGLMPVANGLPQCVSATPHSAMPHRGSCVQAFMNASRAGANSKECSSAAPWMNCGWAAALHEGSNLTVPRPPSWACVSWPAALCPERTVARISVRWNFMPPILTCRSADCIGGPMRNSLCLAGLILCACGCACGGGNTPPAGSQTAPGAGRTPKTAALETGAAALQAKAPVEKIAIYLDGFHVAKDDPKMQMEAHHYCNQVN